MTTVTILSNGSELDATAELVSMDIRRAVSQIPRAVLTFLDGDPATQEFALSSSDDLAPGVEVEIKLGYSTQETTVFKGLVTRHRVALGRASSSRLVMEVTDKSFVMTKGRRSRSFTDVTDSDAMETVITDHSGLSANVTTTRLTQPQLVQYQVSDWDFLVMLAEANAMDVTVLDGAVTIAAPPVLGTAAITGVFGENVFDADLDLISEDQLAKVETGGWDAAAQELLLAQADDAPTPGPGNLQGPDMEAEADTALRHGGDTDQAQLDLWALSVMSRRRRAAVRGRITLQGNSEVLPGSLLELNGFGDRFNGLAAVTAVRHRVAEGDWRSEITIGHSPRLHAERYQVAPVTAAGAQPSVSCLQIATIEALEGDPAGEDRIEVALKSVNSTDGRLWARQILPDAGDARSFCFRPEVADEVIVGFLGGDTRDPVILGAVHSSAKPAPITGSDDNHEKALITRSGMRLHFDDDQVIATLDTPNGNSLVFSEAEGAATLTDENGNSVTLDADGITLNSAKDINIKATGDVNIEGVNLTLKAQAEAAVEGSASAKLASSGQTVVKGSLVQIN